MDPTTSGPQAARVQTCYRHPERRAGVSCQRCDRPICPSCMHQASVGFQCPQCASKGSQPVYSSRAIHKASATKPYLTMALIGINVAAFVIAAISSQDIGGSSGALHDEGALFAAPLFNTPTGIVASPEFGVAGGEWWRIFTSGFLHFGLIHLGFNMLILWLLGSQIETALGRFKYGLLYFTSLFAGALGVLLLSPFATTAGASGAIFGLMGGAFVLQRSRGINPWSSGLGGLILINILITFAASATISVGGHIGGLVGGFVAGVVLVWIEEKVNAAAAVALCGALAVGFFVASVWAANYAVEIYPQGILPFTSVPA